MYPPVILPTTMSTRLTHDVIDQHADDGRQAQHGVCVAHKFVDADIRPSDLATGFAHGSQWAKAGFAPMRARPSSANGLQLDARFDHRRVGMFPSLSRTSVISMAL